jgi:phenol hydroxylase P0 protein
MSIAVNPDIAKRYVRVIHRRADGFVEFQFAISHTEYFAELMLGEEDFQAFCERNQVIFLSEKVQASHHAFDWTLRDVAQGRDARKHFADDMDA